MKAVVYCCAASFIAATIAGQAFSAWESRKQYTACVVLRSDECGHER